MAAIEEPVNEREEPSINKSSFDVETFCQRHLKCKQCNKSYVDPVLLRCLHTYCTDCLIERAAEKKRKREERIAAGISAISEETGSYYMVPGEAEERSGEVESEEEESNGEIMMEEEAAEPNGEERETLQEDEESCVPHIVYGNENLSAPHDCNAVIQLGDGNKVQDSVNRPLSNIIHAARLKEKLPQGKMKCKKCKEMAKLDL